MARSGVYRRAFVSLDTTEDGKRPNQKGLAFMANIKSQKKRIITNEKRRMRNRAVKSELKTAVRHVKDAVAEGNGKDAYAFACEACRLMDKAASKGVIHKNQAANRKSGIMRLANTVVTAEDIAAYEKPAPKPQKTGSKKAEAKAARATRRLRDPKRRPIRGGAFCLRGTTAQIDPVGADLGLPSSSANIPLDEGRPRSPPTDQPVYRSMATVA